MKEKTWALAANRREELVQTLQTRFENNMVRHPDLQWDAVFVKLEGNAKKLWSLNQMEQTGGEPDVIGVDGETGEFLFCDCAAESPEGRRSICYDRPALDARKDNKPKTSAMDLAADMGIEMLTEEQYRALQQLGAFDEKTSSWVKTPEAIRKLGGALFCDRRYGMIFVYHNGAGSYYAGRSFRGMLRV